MHTLCLIRRKPTLSVLAAFALLWARPAASQTLPCAIADPGKPLPDLIVDGARLKRDLALSRETFASNSCEVQDHEQCVSSPGTHTLLRFSASHPNIGQGDLVIGNPLDCPNLTDAFHFSPCHQHYHFNEYSDYRLWTDLGYKRWVADRNVNLPTNGEYNAGLLSAALQRGELVQGRKQGFCAIDIEPFAFPGGPTGTEPKYTQCGRPNPDGTPNTAGNQGIQVGWTDVYRSGLPCQFVEMDSFPDGFYVLEVEVNAERLFAEADYSNNSSAVRFKFTKGKGKQSGRLTNVAVKP